MNTTTNQPDHQPVQELRSNLYAMWVDSCGYDMAPDNIVEVAMFLLLAGQPVDFDTEAGLRYFSALCLAYADLIVSAVDARAEAEAADWADKTTDPAPAEGILRRTTVVDLPAPDSVWYLFQNPDLRVRVVASNADAVFYTDARIQSLNREDRRNLPKSAFETQTQPLFHFLAAATPEASDAH